MKYIDAGWHYPTKGEYPIIFGKYEHEHYPQIPCLVLFRGMYGVRYWNCTEDCWDDEECDDFFCSKDEVEKWMYIDSLQQDHLPDAGKMVEQEHIADVSKMIEQAVQLVFDEKLTPFKDGDQWCFLLGRNIQDGVCGFGNTILDAAVDFYRDYESTKINIVELKISLEQPEVELEKEVINYFEGYWPGMETAAQCNTQMRLTPPAIMRLVKHFFQLGLTAGKAEWLKDRDGCFWDGVEEGKKAMEKQMMKELPDGDLKVRAKYMKTLSHDVYVESEFLDIDPESVKVGD